MTTASEAPPRAQKLDLDAMLELLQDPMTEELPVLDGTDDARAARMMGRRQGLERELKAGRSWWENRRDAIKRALGWLDDNLETWARISNERTGLKTFPCGEGMARLQRARAKVEWDDDSTSWLLELAEDHPELIKSFDLAAVLKHHVAWSEPNADGVCAAHSRETGEELPGLFKDLRAGELTCSVK